jgi:hypothetical protein
VQLFFSWLLRTLVVSALARAALSHVAQPGSITRLNSIEPFVLSLNMNAPSVENRALSGEDEAPPTNDKALPQPVNNTFADGNHGFQAGIITGHVKAEFHHHAPGTVRLEHAQRPIL